MLYKASLKNSLSLSYVSAMVSILSLLSDSEKQWTISSSFHENYWPLIMKWTCCLRKRLCCRGQTTCIGSVGLPGELWGRTTTSTPISFTHFTKSCFTNMPQELSKREVGRQTPKETGVNAGKRGKPAKATTTRRGFLKKQENSVGWRSRHAKIGFLMYFLND